MVTRTEKIADRFPHFYLRWDHNSLVYSFIHAMGTRFDEMEKDLVTIMRSHWVDSAKDGDLDRQGNIFNLNRKSGETDKEYRNRLKMAITSYKGGGTLRSIQMMIRITLGLPQDYPVEIVENPPRPMKRTWKVRANQEWLVNPRSICETVPEITLTVVSPNVVINNPTITNQTTNESISFAGKINTGDILVFRDGRAFLNDTDSTEGLSPSMPPTLPRTRSEWRYTEDIGSNIGVFDQTLFDSSVFAVDILSNITFNWVAYQPASFEVRIPREDLQKAGITEQYLQEIVDVVKAVGVQGIVTVLEGGEK
jgi:hypothetical protein